MHILTKTAFSTLQDLWHEIYEHEAQGAPGDALCAFWRAAANIADGYALQHQGAGDPGAADTMQWLADIARVREDMERDPAGSPILGSAKPKISIVRGSVRDAIGR